MAQKYKKSSTIAREKAKKVAEIASKLPAGRLRKQITDAEFWEILAENGGLIARAARAIEAKYGFSITYQAVRARALKHPEMLAYVKEYNVERAVGVIQGLMLTSRREDVRLKAAETYLKAVGGIAPLTIQATAEGAQDEGKSQAVALTIKIQQ